MTRLVLLTRAEQTLRIGSGLCALGVAVLLVTRAPVTQAPTTVTTVYTPVVKVEVDGAFSESESAASGYLLLIETTPEGAEVFVNGISKGPSPASINLDCVPGNPLRLELRRSGYRPLKRAMTCKRDVMVVVHARLNAAK